MKNEVKSTNYVFLQGQIGSPIEYSHDLYDERFYEFTLKVPRLSEQLDELPITVSQSLVEGLREGDKIALTGQFRSFNRPDGERSRLILSVFAREILPVKDDVNPNTAQLTGYICKPPVYRTTPFNRETAPTANPITYRVSLGARMQGLSKMRTSDKSSKLRAGSSRAGIPSVCRTAARNFAPHTSFR